MKNDQIISRDTRPNAHPRHMMGRNQLTFERTDALGQSWVFFSCRDGSQSKNTFKLN